MKNLAAGLCAALILAGCATPRIPPAPVPPSPPGWTAAQLDGMLWMSVPKRVRVKQSACFTFRGRTVPMAAMMELNGGQRRARLVAVNELGIKLFDLEISDSALVEHFVLPELARIPRFSEAVATSVRRLFLAPRPRVGDDRLDFVNGRYRMLGKRLSGEVEFFFGGDPPLLAETRMDGEGERWQAVFRDYRMLGAGFWPYDVRLRDDRAGYLLELRILEARGIDEPD
ncbi:MAG: hypothetical protein JXB25_06110 [Deltaproteobacteria bacterium]|nr:hypothetical protein [Deltaproteobacteria bacterium]